MYRQISPSGCGERFSRTQGESWLSVVSLSFLRWQGKGGEGWVLELSLCADAWTTWMPLYALLDRRQYVCRKGTGTICANVLDQKIYGPAFKESISNERLTHIDQFLVVNDVGDFIRWSDRIQLWNEVGDSFELHDMALSLCGGLDWNTRAVRLMVPHFPKHDSYGPLLS